MPRNQIIDQASFGQTPLPLVVSARVGRTSPPRPMGDDSGVFVTSVQLGLAVITAEIQMRDVFVAESLALGSQDDLSFMIEPCQDKQQRRKLTLHGAVLYSVELLYEQAAPAAATLRFAAESSSPTENPVTAVEVDQ